MSRFGVVNKQHKSELRHRPPHPSPIGRRSQPHVLTEAEKVARGSWLVLCGPYRAGAFDGLGGAFGALGQYCNPNPKPTAPAAPGAPPPPVNVGYVLMQQARASVTPPKPVLGGAPPLTDAQLVGFPTWFWTTNFDAIQSSASLAGITATVRAEPVRTTWVFRPTRTDVDVETVTLVCEGDAPAWDPDGGDGQRSDCTHRFEWSGSYETTVTTTYAVTWTATDGQAGGLPDLTATANVEIPVQQAQALVR